MKITKTCFEALDKSHKCFEDGTCILVNWSPEEFCGEDEKSRTGNGEKLMSPLDDLFQKRTNTDTNSGRLETAWTLEVVIQRKKN